MIIKILSRKTDSFRQLLRYILEGDERVPESNIITHNMKGGSIPEWVAEFEDNESHRKQKRANSVILTHEILSWHMADAPTLSMIEDMARQYIEYRNPAGLYVGAVHFAKEHYHVHLCVGGVEYKSGTSLRMSKRSFKKLKLEIEGYQRHTYPELTHSRVNHNPVNSRQKHKTYWIQKRGTTPTTDLIRNTIQKCLQQTTSSEEFFRELQHYGLTPYYRNHKLTGVWLGNRKYRLSRLGFGKDMLKAYERNR